MRPLSAERPGISEPRILRFVSEYLTLSFFSPFFSPFILPVQGQGDERYNPPLFPPLNSPFERRVGIVCLGRPLPLARTAFLGVSWQFFRRSPTRKTRLTGRFRRPLAVLPFCHFVIPHGRLSRPYEKEVVEVSS